MPRFKIVPALLMALAPVASAPIHAATPARAASHHDRAQRSVSIVFIGDSITYGAAVAVPKDQAPPVISTAWLREHVPSRRFYFSNQGKGGHTTVDTLPETQTDFLQIEQAAARLKNAHPGQLIFSIMLGTNDSAMDGPLGSPVSPEAYRKNLTAVIDRLLQDYPRSKIVLHHPIWYSPNTYNGSRYLAEGLKRLQAYFPQIDQLVAQYGRTHPRQVFRGDTKAFDFFRKNHKAYLVPEKGQRGIFYLHPNKEGSEILGKFWAAAICTALQVSFLPKEIR